MVQDRCDANLDAAISRTPIFKVTLVNSSMCADHWKADVQVIRPCEAPHQIQRPFGRQEKKTHHGNKRTDHRAPVSPQWNSEGSSSTATWSLTHMGTGPMTPSAICTLVIADRGKDHPVTGCDTSWPRTPSSADRWCGPWDPYGCVPPPRRSARTTLGSPCR